MSGPTSTPDRVIPPQVTSEAAAWVARLHAEDRSPKVEAAFREWLAADPSHREAFELASDVWQAASTLPQSIVSRYPSWQQVQLRRRTVRLTAAFAVVAVLAVGLFIFHELRDRGLTTGVGEQRTVTLADGTRVTLNTQTRLIVRYGERVRRVELDAGEALFEVAREPQRPFVVRVGDREVRALGTAFLVRHDGEKIAVTLVEGKVSVAAAESNPNASSLTPAVDQAVLEPGQRLTISAGAPPQLDRPSIEVLTAWRQGRIVFEHTPLAEAIEEMSRYSERRFSIEGAGVADFRVSGIFRAGDVENFALAVASTYGLEMRSEPRGIVLSPAEPPGRVPDE